MQSIKSRPIKSPDGGNYATGMFSVLRTTDEDGNRTFEFTDKLGRTVLTRSMNGNEKLDTYHVWNLYGKPCAVLPPAASDALANSNDTCWASTHEVLEKHAYLYRYHAARGTLCTAKKLPGCGWTLYRYDQNNRLIFTQDAVLRAQGKWRFTLPDVHGRICMTGIYTNTESSLQGLSGKSVVVEEDHASVYGYSIRDNTVTLANPTVHAVNFHDGYAFRSLQHFTDTGLDYTVENGYDTRYYTDKAEGLLTGTMTAVMDGNTVTGYQPSVMYYDYRGRLIQTKSGKHLGGMEKEWLALDFTGNVTKRKHVHTASGETTQTEVYTYTYDHTGRLLAVKHSLNGGTETTLTANEYDELGRLENVTHNGKANLKTEYSYNIRSWVTNMSSPLYSQTLTYGYGGNISSQQWVQDSKTRKYTYTYDGLNRLTHAAYTGDGNYTANYSYDNMGNITSLKRYDVSLVDNLTYTYNGNQLTKVEDATSNAFGFANGANTTNEYTYDANGNLTKDSNKGIASITYNSLNLPQVVTFSNGNTITYLYTADGRKLRTVHVTNGTATTTDYCRNVIYENGTQKLLLTEEGYVDLVNSNTYYYYLKDHQGNNRVAVSSSGTVMETNHYYPFGGVFSTNTNVQPYKYNGKELDSKNSLNWYDYGARHYDAALGRWFAADPLSEKYYADSPYIYCGSNPVNRIDLFGMDYWSTSNPDEISRFWSWMSQSGENGIGTYSFITDSWNRMTDKVFLEAYGKYGQQALTYNDQTYKLYSSYVTYENGEIVVNGVSTTALGLLSNKAFGLEDAYSLGMTAGGFFAGAKEMSYVYGGSWKGKNGKWNNLSWGGNQYTGARRVAVSKANIYNGIGKGLFWINLAVNIIQGFYDYRNVDKWTHIGLNTTFGIVSTWGGIPGMIIGGFYWGASFRHGAITPLPNNYMIIPVDNTYVSPYYKY